LDDVLVSRFNKAIQTINLRKSPGNKLTLLLGNGGGLGLVYPKFAAWLLSQANPAKGTPDLVMMDGLKHNQIFEGGCQTASVPNTKPTTPSATLTIKVIGSVCLIVKTTKSFWVYVKQDESLPEAERLHLGWDGNVQNPMKIPISVGKGWHIRPNLMSRKPTGDIYLVFSNVGTDLREDTVAKTGATVNDLDIPPTQEHEFKIFLSPSTGSSRFPLP
jgi:hypothetical protein